MDQPETVQLVTAEIQQDWEVFGSDGQKIGNVNEVHTNFLWVQEGLLFPTDMYIPITAVARTESGRVELNVTTAAVSTAGWDKLPEAIATNSAIPGAVAVSAAEGTQ